MKRRTGAESIQDNAQRHAPALYLLFGLTGIGLVAPGTLLPFLVHRWGWQDGRSGLLFCLFFVGTSIGAFCARGMLGRMLVLAAFAIALPFALLPVLQGVAILGAILLFGFGLGLAMTSITLLRSRQVPAGRAVELTRLNLIWAMGAAFAPFLLIHSTTTFGLAATSRTYAVAVCLCGMVAGIPLWAQAIPAEGTWAAWRYIGRLPAVFVVSLPLSTGIEAGVGAWLVTFTLRDQAAHRAVITAGSALWAGLFLSRLLFAGSGFRFLRRRDALLYFSGLLVFGLFLLFHGALASTIVIGAFCTGFGIGPVYPQMLARMLNYSEAGNAGFLLAGAGSALLPLLIGQVSQQAHSLRMGLSVPLIGSLILLGALVWAERNATRRPAG